MGGHADTGRHQPGVPRARLGAVVAPAGICIKRPGGPRTTVGAQHGRRPPREPMGEVLPGHGLGSQQPCLRGLEFGFCQGSGCMEARQALQLIGQLADGRLLARGLALHGR